MEIEVKLWDQCVISLGAPYIKTSDNGLSEESVHTAERVLAVLRIMKIVVFGILFGEYCLLSCLCLHATN